MPATVNPQVVDLVNQVQVATLSPTAVGASGAGKAYQSVAQSMAIAIQDATDYLRNTQTISSTAAGALVAQYLATGDASYLAQLATVQAMVTTATTDFTAIGAASTGIINAFPVGLKTG